MRKNWSILLLTLALGLAASTAFASYQTITNDAFYLTTNGSPVYAQGGGISKFGNTYYWYGMQYAGMSTYYAHPTSGNATANTGFVAINCYSSTDLVHWTFQNKVISTATANFTSGVGWVGRMGSVVYNSSTQQYVMWFQYTGSAGSGQACCTCSTPTGNFTINNVQTSITNVYYNTTGDCTIFCDVDHGSTPYLVFSDPHGREHLYVSSLSANYTAINPATLISEWPQGQEANNMFERNGLYYACMSNLAGWSYSSAYEVSSPSIQTPSDYSADATFAGTDLSDTYYSQISFVVPVAGSQTTNYILVGDRWSQNDSSYLSAGHGLGFNIMGPVTFNGTTPTFVPLASFQLDAVTGNWRITPAFAAPSGLTATPGPGNIALSWDASGGATNYTIQRATASTGPYSNITTGLANTTYTDSGLTNGTTYYYEIAAANSTATSSFTLPVSAIPSTTPAPAAPGELTLSPSTSQVALSWDASTGATTYLVQRATSAGGPYTTIASGLTSTTFTDTSVTYGPTYYYEIIAVGSSNSTSSPPVSISLTGNVTWSGSSSAAWDITSTNWLYGSTPALYEDGDSVSFNDAGANTSITITSAVNPASVTFSNSATSYTVGGANISGTASLSLTGTGQVTLTGANNYNGLTSLGAGSTLVVGNAAALDNTTVDLTNGSLDFAGGITSATFGGVQGTNATQNLALTNSSSAAVALTVGGNNATTTYSGNLSGTGSVTKVGSGALTLANVNYTGATSVNAGSLTISGTLGSSGNPAGAVTASGGTLNLKGAAIFAPSLTQNSNSGNVFLTASGTISLSGALGVNANNSDTDGVVSLASGTLSAASATIGRDGSNLGATAPTAGSTTDGLYVNGATVAITTTLSVGYFNGAENSSGQMRVDAGSVTVGGVTTVANDAGSRFSLLDLNGGTFTDNDTSGTGILIGGSADASLDAELLVRGTAVLNTPAITVGTASDTGGLLEFMALGGTTYLGAGGIVSTAPSGTTVTIALGSASVATAPTLAASAGWSSSRPMTLTNNSAGATVTFQTANASGIAENITLSGVLSGTGGLTATGNGTLTLGAANTYTGATTISSGTVNLSGSLASSVTLQSGASLGGTGVITGNLAMSSGAGLLLNASGNVAVTGSVTFGGNVTVTAAANLPVGNYTLLGYGGTLSGSPVFTYVPPSGASQGASFSTTTAHLITVSVFGPPSAPANLTATAGLGNITLNWTASAGAASYTVRRSTTNGSGYATIATNVIGTTYADTTAASGTIYYYTVVATNSAGNSAVSSSASGATLPPAPAAPTGLTATAGNGNVTLNWTASANATSYLVQRSTTSGSGYGVVDGDVAATTYTDSGLANGTTYYYVVAAANTGGTSGNSTEVSATPAQSLTQWASTEFPGQTDPSVVGPTANPSGDGLPNLLKYFFGLDPTVNAGSSPVSSAPDNSGNMIITFPLAKNLIGVTYQIQSSPDLLNWTNTGVSAVVVSDQGTYYQMQATVPTGANTKLYLRVSVTQTP